MITLERWMHCLLIVKCNWQYEISIDPVQQVLNRESNQQALQRQILLDRLQQCNQDQREQFQEIQ